MPSLSADLCIYGATSAGIAAAITARRLGKTVVLLDAGTHIGGLTTGGLGATDIGHKFAVGGIAREFYERVHAHYAQPGAWKWAVEEKKEARDDARDKADQVAEQNGRPTKWTFEPSVASAIFRSMLSGAGVAVHTGHPLTGVTLENGKITSLLTSTGSEYIATVFIDASYEGDLLAAAGCSFHVGREANAVYGETHNGVRAHTPHHQFHVPVDPYVEPGNAASGLLPFIQDGPMGEPGSGDAKLQAYCFRLCMTQVAENRVPWEAPAGYAEADYELVARLLAAHEAAGKPLSPIGWGGMMYPASMPNGKTDTNNSEAFSFDYIGGNYAFPTADHAARQAIIAEHERYQRGFLYYLATGSKVPQRVKDEVNTWGLARDEFVDNNNWPTQLYVREARRLISDYVISEGDCRGQRVAPDSVGVATYQMDSHNCQRVVQDGLVVNEGDVQFPVDPYPISYSAITPKVSECTNLLVPVCLSASHIAYGSIRMEPIFMILGQSAATAAALAIDMGCTVQTVPYDDLEARLLAAGQVLDATLTG